MRRIALSLTIAGTMLLGAGSAQASTLFSGGGVIIYTANQGELNDVQVGTGNLLGGTVGTYTFTDLTANPITITGGPCELINGVGMCRQDFVSSMIIDVRDRDDSVKVGETVGAWEPTSTRADAGATTYRRSTGSATPSFPAATVAAMCSARTRSIRAAITASSATTRTRPRLTNPAAIGGLAGFRVPRLASPARWRT